MVYSSFVTKGLKLPLISTKDIHRSNRDNYRIMININAMIKLISLTTSGNELTIAHEEFGNKITYREIGLLHQLFQI